MDVETVRRIAGEWVETNRGEWPGLRAAHFVGSVTGMRAEEPFPAHKDVDLHLVFEAGSPMLQVDGPFPNLMEAEYRGVLIEAGVKPLESYATAEAVLANPEVAHHLTLDSVVFDPDGLLGALQPRVRAEYAEPRWIAARVEHERQGLAAAMSLLPMARAMLGASGEINLLGYSMTFVAAAMQVAHLEAPSTGSRAMPHLRRLLGAAGRPELYETALEVLGIARVDVGQVKALLTEAEAAFDVAVRVRRSPHPFQHKLHAHLKPYFVQSCRVLLDEGEHREALHWLLPFYLSACDVILADGPDEAKARFAPGQAGLIADLGLSSEEARDAAFRRSGNFQAECFTLAAQGLP